MKLGAAGAAACALPTLHLASASGTADLKPAAAGKIFIPASLKTGMGNDDWPRGVFAIDPETATCNKVCDFYWYVSRRMLRGSAHLTGTEGTSSEAVSRPACSVVKMKRRDMANRNAEAVDDRLPATYALEPDNVRMFGPDGNGHLNPLQ